MKRIVSSILFVILIASLITVAFTFRQINQEEQSLQADLQYRSTLAADSLRESVEPNFINKSDAYLQSVVERFATKERFAGLAIYDNKTATVAASTTIPTGDERITTIVSDVMDADKASGDFVKLPDGKIYVFAIPLHDTKSVVGALMVAQNASYIDTRLWGIWRSNLARLFTQAFLLSLAVLLILRWVIYEPIRALVLSLKAVRNSSSDPSERKLPNNPFLRPLAIEVENVRRSLWEAKSIAQTEAKLRLEKLDTPWTAGRLSEFVKDILKGRKIYTISNREPYIHDKDSGHVRYHLPASGMATAIEPMMQACGGTWVAHGSGSADREVVDEHDRIKVPPDDPKYVLRRVWLTEKEENGYYNGFSNEGLWPLCHIAHTRPLFRKEDWEEYKRVNGKFAEVVLSEIKGESRPVVFIQDYHFALLPKIIKKTRPDATIGMFWHIPWPNWESFSVCPYRKEILDGMLGADLLGFHTQLHCNNFVDTIGKELESLIDWEQFAVERGGHTTVVKPFPISIAFSDIRTEQESKGEHALAKEFDVLKDMPHVAIGVDRLDYTKGILERLQAIELFFESYPAYRMKTIFVQVAAPSRSKIAQYQEFERDVESEVHRINKKFQRDNWKPIHFSKRHHSHDEIDALYKQSDVCLVTSLHDGMNLVAKEYIVSHTDERGVLILSQFAGASRELKEATIVNPYNIAQVSESIKEGFEMLQSEQMRRMRKMRSTVKEHNVYRWSADFLRSLLSLS